MCLCSNVEKLLLTWKPMGRGLQELKIPASCAGFRSVCQFHRKHLRWGICATRTRARVRVEKKEKVCKTNTSQSRSAKVKGWKLRRQPAHKWASHGTKAHPRCSLPNQTYGPESALTTSYDLTLRSNVISLSIMVTQSHLPLLGKDGSHWVNVFSASSSASSAFFWTCLWLNLCNYGLSSVSRVTNIASLANMSDFVHLEQRTRADRLTESRS